MKDMGKIEFYKITRKTEGACDVGEQDAYELTFSFESNDITDRITAHGNRITVNTEKENADYIFDDLREIFATCSGVIEVYFSGNYKKVMH